MWVGFERDQRLNVDPEVAAVVFRSMRELLANVFEHAGVPGAPLTLGQDGDRVSVTVADVGAGFDPSGKGGARSAEGFDLFSIREQIERLGGSMSVRSAPGRGTRVALVVPRSRRSSDSPPRGDRE